MIKHNQDGAVSGLGVSLALAIVMLLASIGFGVWAFTSRQDYKDNSDAKAKVAADEAVKANSLKKDKEFAEAAKKPYVTYKGPAAYGALSITYPKTWSAYAAVTENGSPLSGGALVDTYFNPAVVPNANSKASTFALRAQVLEGDYASTLKDFDSPLKEGRITVSAYALPKMPNVVGVRVVGEVTEGKKVNMVVLPLRSQTLQIWTDGDQHLADFDSIILPNFTFVP